MNTCCKLIFGDAWSSRGHACGKAAKYEHEGRHYCGTHHPPKVEARKAKNYAEFKARMARESAISRQARITTEINKMCAEWVESHHPEVYQEMKQRAEARTR